MISLLSILIGIVLVNHLVLPQLFGFDSPSSATSGAESTPATSLTTTLVLTLAIAVSWEIDTRLLQPFGLSELRLLFFMLLIAVTVPLVVLAIRASLPARYQAQLSDLPLITINCAVVGVALLITQKQTSLFSALAWGAGTGLGFSLLLAFFARMRERLEDADVPAHFRGAGIGLVTAGMISLALSGFAGMFR